MEHSEIEFVLKAKKQQKQVRIVTFVAIGLAIGMAVLSLALKAFGMDPFYSLAGLIGALLGALCINADLTGPPLISRAQLLSLLELQISRDPEALKYLSSRSMQKVVHLPRHGQGS